MSLAIAWVGHALVAAIIIGIVPAIIGKAKRPHRPVSRTSGKDPDADETLRQMMLDDIAATGTARRWEELASQNVLAPCSGVLQDCLL